MGYRNAGKWTAFTACTGGVGAVCRRQRSIGSYRDERVELLIRALDAGKAVRHDVATAELATLQRSGQCGDGWRIHSMTRGTR